MNLRPEQLAAHLDKPLAPLYVLHGNEPLLVLETGDAIRAAARKQGFAEREVLVAGQGFKWTSCSPPPATCRCSAPANWSTCASPTANPAGMAAKPCSATPDQLDDGVVTLITLPELDWATRKDRLVRRPLRNRRGHRDQRPGRDRLPDWIAQRLARQQQKASPALAFIADHVEATSSPPLPREILKLGLLHPPGDLSFDAVREAHLNVARYNVDSSARPCSKATRPAARASSKASRAKARPRHSSCGRSPTRSAPSPTCARVSTTASLPGPDEGRTDLRRPAPPGHPARPARLGRRPLRTAILHAAQIDRMIKGLVGGDVWDEFLQLCLRLTRDATPARRR